MNNTAYTYPTRKISLKTVRDYTAVYYGGLSDIFDQYPDYFMYYDIIDDEKLENISYKLYGSEDYADIILAINNEVFLWGLPYGSDIIYDQQDTYVSLLEASLNVYSSGNSDFEAIAEEIGVTLDQENSSKRIYKVPKSKSINNVITLINNYRDENTYE